MAKERAPLNLNEDLDVSEFKPIQKTDNKNETEIKKIEQVAKQSGFVTRANKSQRRRKPQSPYKNQLNLKCRENIKELFQDIGAQLGVHDHTTFELALLALIKENKYNDLLQRYKEITE